MCKWLIKYFGGIFDLVKCFKYSLPFTGMCLKETTGSGDENTYSSLNRPFPSSPGPLYQNEVKCSAFDLFIYLFYFICHTNYKKYRKRRRRKKKKKWRGDLTETIGAYESLGLLEL